MLRLTLLAKLHEYEKKKKNSNRKNDTEMLEVDILSPSVRVKKYSASVRYFIDHSQ